MAYSKADLISLVSDNFDLDSYHKILPIQALLQSSFEHILVILIYFMVIPHSIRTLYITFLQRDSGFLEVY
jgi:hypothetical protein